MEVGIEDKMTEDPENESKEVTIETGECGHETKLDNESDVSMEE